MATIEKVVVDNPFDISKRRTLPISLEDGQALIRYLDGAGEEVITIVNGVVIPPQDRSIFVPKDGDQLIILPEIQDGGGGAKGILRSIALIGVAILATVFAGPLGAALGIHSVALAQAVGAAIIMTAGSLLVSAILPLPKQEQTQISQNYGWSGPALASRQGLPIPKPFGKFKQAGNVISSYIKTQGDKQYMNILICYGFGPAVSISDIRINDQPISNYQGIQYEVRLGTNDQKVISFFSDSVNDRAQQKRLRTGESFFQVDGDRDDTQALEVEFYFPRGIWAGPDNNGKFDEWAVYGTLQYKLHTDSTWKDHLLPGVTSAVGSTPYWIAVSQEIFGNLPLIVVYATDDDATAHSEGDLFDELETVNIYDSTGSFVGTDSRRHVATWMKNPGNPSTGAASMGGTPQVVTQWNNENFVVSSNSQNAKRYVYRIDHLTPGKYDVRVLKRGANKLSSGRPADSSTEDFSRRGEEMWLGAVREIVYDDFVYPNMILLGLRALATDQLSGGGINITAVVDTGLANPSKIAQAMMTDPLWGGSISANNLDRPLFDDWEDYCNELVAGDGGQLIKRAEWHGVFDTTGSLWDQLAIICAVSRANIVRTGLNYTVIIDKPAVPVQLFTVGNIIKGSFKESWLSLADRANSIDLRYSDASKNYEVTPLTVNTQEDLGINEEIRKAPLLDLRGVVDASHAFHEGDLRLRQTTLLKRSVEFEAPVEAIACRVGDVIKIQHDVPRWGEGGKLIRAADVTHITLDKEVLIQAGKNYVLTIIFPALVIASNTGGLTATIEGATVTLSSNVNTDYTNLRLILPDGEYEVSDFDGTHITLTKSVGISGVQAFQLVAIDAIATQTVANVPSVGQIHSRDIIVSPGFIGLPFPNSAYAFGELLKEGRDFRVISIGKSSDLTSSISALEYLDSFYGEIDPILPPAPAGDDADIAVTNLDAHEAYIVDSSVPRIAISWTPGKYTRGADIYLSSTDGFVPLPPIVRLASTGSIGFFDIWLRLTYTLTDGSETAASLPIKVSGANTSTNAVLIIDRGTTLDDAASFNIYVAAVASGAGEPPESDYRFALGTTNQLSAVLASTGANSGSGVAWTTPANVHSTSSYAAVTLDTSNPTSQQLDSAFSLSIPNEDIAGIIVTFDAAAVLGSVNDLSDNLEVKLVLGGMVIGTAKTARVSGASSSFLLGTAGDKWGTAITYANLNDPSFRVSFKGTFKGARAGADMPVSVLLNGWGPNGHVGDYEGGINQGHVFGLNSGGSTQPYTSPNSAFDGHQDTAASSVFQHTHQYAGCVWKFSNPSAPTIPNGLVLRILSEIPFNGQYGYSINARSAGIWYSLNSGASWINIYNSSSRTKQWSEIILPNGTDPTHVQVMAFNDSHDYMVHFVYEITLGLPPTDQISVRNVNIQVFGTAGTTSFAIGGSAELDSLPASGNASLEIQPGFVQPKLIASVERQHEFAANIESSGFYVVRAVGFDAAGKRASFNNSPVVSTAVLGDGSLPKNVQSFRVTSVSLPTVSLAWDAIDDADLDHYEIRYNYSFDGTNWDRAISIATPSSSATTATVSKGAGTYFIKAINTADKESGIASTVVAGRTDTRSTTDPDPDPRPRGGINRPIRSDIGDR